MATTRDDKRERSKVPWLNVRISPEERAELDDYLANDPQLSRMDKGAAIAYLIELGVERYQQDQSVLSLVKEKRKEHDDHIRGCWEKERIKTNRMIEFPTLNCRATPSPNPAQKKDCLIFSFTPHA